MIPGTPAEREMTMASKHNRLLDLAKESVRALGNDDSVSAGTTIESLHRISDECKERIESIRNDIEASGKEG